MGKRVKNLAVYTTITLWAIIAFAAIFQSIKNINILLVALLSAALGRVFIELFGSRNEWSSQKNVNIALACSFVAMIACSQIGGIGFFGRLAGGGISYAICFLWVALPALLKRQAKNPS